jgi:hypothetical protein
MIKSQTKNCATVHQWLMPVILVTQDAEIRRTGVQSQPGNNSQDCISKMLNTKQGW